LILSKILFGGFGRRGGWNRGRVNGWKNRFEEKMAAMTPEEREKFKAEWKNRCGRGRWNMPQENTSETKAE